MIALSGFGLAEAGPYRGTLPAGSVVGLIGRGGTQVTQFLEAVCGARRHRGQVLVHGRVRRSRDVAYAPEEPEQILFGRTGRDALGGGAGEQTLIALGGGHLLERDFLTLSSGERRRLALAAVLGSGRPLLLFDLPTAGLDPEGQDTFWRAVEQYPGVCVVSLLEATEAVHCTALWTVPGEGEPLRAQGIVPAPVQRAAGWPPDPLADLAWTIGSEARDQEHVGKELRRWAIRDRS